MTYVVTLNINNTEVNIDMVNNNNVIMINYVSILQLFSPFNDNFTPEQNEELDALYFNKFISEEQLSYVTRINDEW